MEIKYNKKASEKLFSLWWFLVLAIVGGGIVGGVFMFYSVKVDMREAESHILYNKLMNCLVKQGYVLDNFFNTDFNVLRGCGLNRDVINSGIFYFKIGVYDNNGSLLKEISEGTSSFENHCKIRKEILAKEFPKCVEKEETVLYYNNGEKKLAKIYILTASNHDK